MSFSHQHFPGSPFPTDHPPTPPPALPLKKKKMKKKKAIPKKSVRAAPTTTAVILQTPVPRLTKPKKSKPRQSAPSAQSLSLRPSWNTEPPSPYSSGDSDVDITSDIVGGDDPVAYLSSLISSPSNFKRFLEKGGYDYESAGRRGKVKKEKKEKDKEKETEKKSSAASSTAKQARVGHALSIKPSQFGDASYLKHITYHEAAAMAQKPLKEATGKIAELERSLKSERVMLVGQVATLVANFRRFKVIVAMTNLAQIRYNYQCRAPDGVYESFRRWSALANLDFVRRQNKMNRVPKVILAWVNRHVTKAFGKWRKVVQDVRDVSWRLKSTQLTVKLLLRNKARKEMGVAFSKMRAGGGVHNGGRRELENVEPAYFNQGVSWTEVPPSPFM